MSAFGKISLVARMIGFMMGLMRWRFGFSRVKSRSAAQKAGGPAPPLSTKSRNIIVIGVSFGGEAILCDLAEALPADSPWRIIAIEPHSHMQFTWALPRFSVVSGHDDKAFVPYDNLVATGKGKSEMIRDRVVEIKRDCVVLASGREIDYAFVVIASGTSAGSGGLPSRVGADTKEEGVKQLQQMRANIRDSNRLVVVGGGAAGVELAADAKEKYPDKNIVLVHSRSALMHRFGAELQSRALKALQDLGVKVILQDRVVSDTITDGVVALKSGKTLECDLLLNCSGQKPNSQMIASLSPSSLTESGYILVKPTMQIADDSLPNVYAVGDVTDCGVTNPNGIVAVYQGMITTSNLIQAMKGEQPSNTFTPHWALQFIKLTLGLSNAVTQFGDGSTEILISSKKTPMWLNAETAWDNFKVGDQFPREERHTEV